MFKRLRAAHHEYCRSVEYMRAIDEVFFGVYYTAWDYVELPLINALRAYRNDK